MTTAEIADRLQAKPTSGGWAARCPAHEDKNASLCISEAPDGKTLIHCQAGCKFNAVVSAMGLKSSDLFPAKDTAPRVQHKTAQRKPGRTFPTAEAAARACTPQGATLNAVYNYQNAAAKVHPIG
jgi:hypothetical protein